MCVLNLVSRSIHDIMNEWLSVDVKYHFTSLSSDTKTIIIISFKRSTIYTNYKFQMRV